MARERDLPPASLLWCRLNNPKGGPQARRMDGNAVMVFPSIFETGGPPLERTTPNAVMLASGKRQQG
jgi:hypothetical protein